VLEVLTMAVWQKYPWIFSSRATAVLVKSVWLIVLLSALVVVAADFEPSDREVHSRQQVLRELLAIIRNTYPGTCKVGNYLITSIH